MIRPSLTNLETLFWINRLETFTAAAERLNTTQPAISARIRDLEASLGVKLFSRHGRKMQPTREGRELIRRLEPVLSALEETLSSLGDIRSAAGTIRFGLGNMSMTWFAPFLGRLNTQFPKVTFDIDIDLAVNLRRKLEESLLDIIIFAGTADDFRFTTGSIGFARVSWLMSAKRMPARQRGNANLMEVFDAGPIWCMPRGTTFFPDPIAELQRAGAKLDNVNTCTDVSALVGLIAEGRGLGLIPDLLAASRLKAGELIHVPGLEPKQIPFTIARRRDLHQPLVVKIMDLAVKGSGYTAARRKAAPRA
jgi:DNA-binding transcriptional LysR family regulator